MNRYGRQAQEALKSASPTRYSQIQNPEEFFTKLGEEAETQVVQLQRDLVSPGASAAEEILELRLLTAGKETGPVDLPRRDHRLDGL